MGGWKKKISFCKASLLPAARVFGLGAFEEVWSRFVLQKRASYLRARALLERQIIYMTSQSREPRSRDHPAQPKCKRHIQHPLPYYRPRKARRDQRNHSESQTQRDKLELCSSVKLGNGTNDSGAVTTALALAHASKRTEQRNHIPRRTSIQQTDPRN